MIANGAALTLCRFSDEPSNANEVAFPRWREVPFHAPTATAAALLLVAVGGGLWGVWPRLRSRKGATGST